MRVLFVNINSVLLELLSKLFIPYDVEIHNVETFRKAVKILNKVEFDLILCDIDYQVSIKKNKFYTPFSFLFYIREKLQITSKIILLSNNNKPDNFFSFIKYGIYCMIPKDNVVEMLKQFYYALNTLTEFKKNCATVKPDPGEEAKIKFVVHDNSHIISDIVYVSLKGIAFNAFDIEKINLDENITMLDNIEVTLQDKFFKVKGNLVIQNQIAYIIFDNLSKISESMINRYVVDKIFHFMKTKKQ